MIKTKFLRVPKLKAQSMVIDHREGGGCWPKPNYYLDLKKKNFQT